MAQTVWANFTMRLFLRFIRGLRPNRTATDTQARAHLSPRLLASPNAGILPAAAVTVGTTRGNRLAGSPAYPTGFAGYIALSAASARSRSGAGMPSNALISAPT